MDVKQTMREILVAESDAIRNIPVTDAYEKAVGSNSGRTSEIIALVQLAKELYSHLPIVVITGNPGGRLAKMADVCLATGGAPEVCPLGLTPTTSTTMMTVMGDVLVVSTMKATGFTREDYAKRHHGGYLGQKSRGSDSQY